MKIFNFYAPYKVIFGKNSLKELSTVVNNLGNKALIVTGKKSAISSGNLEVIITLLNKAKVSFFIYNEVFYEPTTEMVDKGRKTGKKEKCDFVIGIGGGSVLDCAKAIAGLFNENKLTSNFLKEEKTSKIGIPFIAIPTTAGTGAEATKNSVLIDTLSKTKKSIRSDSFYAKIIILDPTLTVSLPPDVTAYSGIDALTQAIESYTSIYSNPLTDLISFEASRLILKNLKTVFNNGKDISARESMLYGSFLSGVALANAKLGAVHGIAHPLGVIYNLPHGLICGILLPHVMKINRSKNLQTRKKYENISEIIGKDIIEFVEEILFELKLIEKFKAFKIQKNDFNRIIKDSINSPSLLANSYKFTENDINKILFKLEKEIKN